MNAIQRLKLRKQLNVSASEFELVQLVDAHALHPLSLSQMGKELMLTKSGVEKMATRLVAERILFKINGKLFVADRVLNMLHPIEALSISNPISTTPDSAPAEFEPTIESTTIPIESDKVSITIEVTYKPQR